MRNNNPKTGIKIVFRCCDVKKKRFDKRCKLGFFQYFPTFIWQYCHNYSMHFTYSYSHSSLSQFVVNVATAFFCAVDFYVQIVNLPCTFKIHYSLTLHFKPSNYSAHHFDWFKCAMASLRLPHTLNVHVYIEEQWMLLGTGPEQTIKTKS